MSDVHTWNGSPVPPVIAAKLGPNSIDGVVTVAGYHPHVSRVQVDQRSGEPCRVTVTLVEASDIEAITELYNAALMVDGVRFRLVAERDLLPADPTCPRCHLFLPEAHAETPS